MNKIPLCTTTHHTHSYSHTTTTHHHSHHNQPHTPPQPPPLLPPHNSLEEAQRLTVDEASNLIKRTPSFRKTTPTPLQIAPPQPPTRPTLTKTREANLVVKSLDQASPPMAEVSEVGLKASEGWGEPVRKKLSDTQKREKRQRTLSLKTKKVFFISFLFVFLLVF